MITKTTLDMLTENSVSVMTQRYVEEDGQEYAVGEPHRCAYVNSERGRAEITAALPEPYLTAVMAIWGTAATVVEEKALPDAGE